MIEPASVSLHAARITPIDVNDVVVVLGSGQIGLFAIQAAHVKGAGTIIALDMKEERLALARQFLHDLRVVGIVLEATAGIDGAGDAEAVQLAHKLTRGVPLIVMREYGALGQRRV